MKISIITVTLNAAEFLAACIHSVLTQDYGDIEYILIDGNSSDTTPDIINRYREHIHHFVSEKDSNQYEALNKGISLATGEVVGILNADDYLSGPGVITDIARTFEKTGCDIVYGDLDYVNRDHTGSIIRKWRSGLFDPKRIQWGWMPAHPTWYVKRRLFEQYGNYRPAYGSSSDYELMIRLMAPAGIACVYLPKVLIKMRTGGTSNVSVRNRMLAARSDFMAMKDNGISFPSLAVILKRVLKIPQFLFLRSKDDLSGNKSAGN